MECDKRPNKEFLHRLDQVLMIDWASRTELLILSTLHPAWKTSVSSRARSTSCSSLGFTQWNGCAHLTWLGWLHILRTYELQKTYLAAHAEEIINITTGIPLTLKLATWSSQSRTSSLDMQSSRLALLNIIKRCQRMTCTSFKTQGHPKLKPI